MFFKQRWFLSIIGLVVIAASATTGYLYWQKLAISSRIERLLPADTFFAVSFQPSDEEERKRFISLWDKILQDKKDVIMPFIADSIAKDNGINLSTADLVKFFGKNFKTVVGLTGNLMQKPKPETPDIYILFSVDDPSAVRDIFKRFKGIEILVDSGNKFLTEFGGEGGNHFGIAGNIVFMTSAKRKHASDILNRFDSIWVDSLVGVDNFREAVSSFKSPSSGYFYVNFDTQKAESAVKSIRVSAWSIHAKPEGLEFNNIVLGNKKELKKSSSAALFEVFKPSLYKVIPANNLAAFFEGHHLGNIISDDFVKSFMPFLDRGFAFSIHDIGSLLPALSLFVDAGSAPDKAKAFIVQMDSAVVGLAALLESMNQPGKTEPILEASKTKNGSLIKIYFNRISQQSVKIPLLEILSQPVELSYGLTDKNILFISMLPNLNLMLEGNNSVENTDLFKRALQMDPSKGEPSNIVLFDGKVFWNFISRLAQAAEKENKLSGQEKSGFEILQKYLSPVKDYVQVSRGDGENIFGKAFLKIGE